ncbi:MAG: ubiquinol-cytochrome c reductase iron-sulfur subunit [Acidimicrobiales bacterium]
MSGTTVLLIAIPVLLLLAAVLVFGAMRRRETDDMIGRLSRETVSRDRSRDERAAEVLAPPPSGREVEQAVVEARSPSASTAVVKAEAAPPAVWVPPDRETIGITRRQFLNRGIVGAMTFSLAAFGAGVLGFLWPSSSGGFGSRISVGQIDDIIADIRANDRFLYVPEGRMWVTEYPSSALDKARQVYSPSELAGMEAGIIALYQKCVHLGCRVPSCVTSQWFECPCHGSQYNQVGEKKGGPAPRGLDRFVMTVEGGSLTVDTGTIIQGPPIGTNTTGQEAEGPHCITTGGEH